MTPRAVVELWGGVECTINRLAGCQVDQLARCGHYGRLDDLDRIAGLGIKRLRYPVLWERVAAAGLAAADWSWSDAVLGRLRELGIEPIIGLVHHGSGPFSTNLLDPRFPDGLAAYAARVAERYPWVRLFTPINESLTTARFSGLYGHWHPHRRDDQAFATALLHQCRAVVQAIHAIRAVTPDAGLVHTEDAGSTRSRPALAEQAAFDDARSWLGVDLILGRVRPGHPLYPYLRSVGIGKSDLEWFEEHGVTPAVLGLNYYATSDRYLDDRLELYPAVTHGGNGRQRYADIEAARVPGVGLHGHAAVLERAWDRYHLPLALTEAHLGCTREEQMRWLLDAWRGAAEAHRRGVDVRAVTVWALLGSWDWDSLVTRVGNHYEPGAFDVRGPAPRPTALARVVRDLADGRVTDHPVLAVPGWWRRDGAGLLSSPVSPILIVGANGTLGAAFARACETRGLPSVRLSRDDVDITDPVSVRSAVARHDPWAIVNAAGYVRVDDAEGDRATCRRVNAVGPSILAAVCRKTGIRLLTFSSDLVFDGQSRRPYVESDPVSPLNVYGRTKAEAEHRVLAIDPAALVVRSSAFFGPWDEYNFVTLALDALAAGRPFRAASDAIISPTYVPDLVHGSLDLLIDGAEGLWHLANAGAVTWADLAKLAAAAAGLDASRVVACALHQLQLRATRPPYSVLGSERGRLLPALEDSLARYVREREALGRPLCA